MEKLAAYRRKLTSKPSPAYPIFIIPPEDDEYHLGKYLAVGEQFGLCHGFGQTKEEALADLRKNIEERAMEHHTRPP